MLFVPTSKFRKFCEQKFHQNHHHFLHGVWMGEECVTDILQDRIDVDAFHQKLQPVDGLTNNAS